MEKYSLTYPLANGYVLHWLATPLTAEPLDARPTGAETEIEFRQRCLSEQTTDALPFADHPVELEPFGGGFWSVEHCKADHLLEKTAAAPVWQRFVRWVYVHIDLPVPQPLNLELGASGAVSLWANGTRTFRNTEFHQPLDHQGPYFHNIVWPSRVGSYDLYLRLEDIAQGDMVSSLCLRLIGTALEGTQIVLSAANSETDYRKATEAIYEAGYLSQPVTTLGDTLTLNFAKKKVKSSQGVLRIQEPSGWIRGETSCQQEPGAHIPSLGSYQMPAGPMHACLMPAPTSFYDLKFQPQRTIPFINAPYRYANEPEGKYEERVAALVQEMANQENIFGEIAKMVLGQWELVATDAIHKAVERVNQRAAGCLLDLLGLVDMVTRLESFNNFTPDIQPEIEAAITGFPYQVDQAFAALQADETDQLLLSACQVLAGQKYSRTRFKASGITGAKERKLGEAKAMALLKQAGQMGWREGYSRLDERIAALAHLADLAKDDAVAELATILLDGSIFALAQYSFKGTFGVPQLRAVPSQLKTARLTPAAAINRLLFGTGNYNTNLVGAFSLAIAKTYEFPELLRSIAAEQPDGAWTMEHSARPAQGWEANQATFKTPDGMLSSLQDYQAGDWGGRVHPWQATLGPEAVVFTNQPASLDQSDARQAGAWGGDHSLPRIAQWKDSLVCLYQLPFDNRVGYTHAYFPTFAFDEYRQEGGWAFARKGDGYLAISASTYMRLVELGDDANCELRAGGPQTAWLVQLGRRTQDGEFKDFCAAVLAHPAGVKGLAVDWTTLRGDHLEFNWSGPLRRNGEEQPLSFAKRFEGPFVDAYFPAESMNVGYGDQLMRLIFS